MILDSCLSLRLGRTWRMASRAYADALKPYTLTPTQLLILLALYEQDGCRSTELAQKIALDKSTMTGVLDRLIRQGYVIRADDGADGRVHRIWLTPEACAIQSDLSEIFHRVNSRTLTQLGSERVEMLWALLADIEQIAAEAQKSEDVFHG